MKCIFCFESSSESMSVEHIIPESLGSYKKVLRRGVVCDKCNNYFSSKVESPVLNHISFQNQRAKYQIPTKKKKNPFLFGYAVNTDIKVGMRINKNNDVEIVNLRESQKKEFDRLKRLQYFGIRQNIYEFPMKMNPPRRDMSRFLAKMAYETLYNHIDQNPDIDAQEIVDMSHYDHIRRFARHGDNFELWPYYYRQYMPEDTQMRHPETSKWVRIGIASDILITEYPETYFTFSIHGHEFTINIGGPSVKGYEMWLKDNNYISPIVEKHGLGLFQGLESDPNQHYLAPLVVIDSTE